ECVARYVGEEELRNGNAHTCSACQKLQSATRITRIHQALSILNVQFNRLIADRSLLNVKHNQCLDSTRILIELQGSSQGNQKFDCLVDCPAVYGIGPPMTVRSTSSNGDYTSD
ncbi:Ubiquitin carboxyl-terminal hydrolase 48, partial [Taenia solium]